MDNAVSPRRGSTEQDNVRRWTRVALFTLAAAGIAWLLTRHAHHVVRLLPLVFLLACPLMHMMHHGRHGGHGGGERQGG